MSSSIWFQGHMYFYPGSSIDTCFCNEFVCVSLHFQGQMYFSPRSSNYNCFCIGFLCISLLFQGQTHFSPRSSIYACFFNGFMCSISVWLSPATAFVFLLPTSSRIIAVAMFALLQKQGSRCSSVPAGAKKIPPTTPGRMWRRRRDNKQEDIRNALFLAFFLR
jgi:hypothetical protein